MLNKKLNFQKNDSNRNKTTKIISNIRNSSQGSKKNKEKNKEGNEQLNSIFSELLEQQNIIEKMQKSLQKNRLDSYNLLRNMKVIEIELNKLYNTNVYELVDTSDPKNPLHYSIEFTTPKNYIEKLINQKMKEFFKKTYSPAKEPENDNLKIYTLEHVEKIVKLLKKRFELKKLLKNNEKENKQLGIELFKTAITVVSLENEFAELKKNFFLSNTIEVPVDESLISKFKQKE